MFPWNITIKYVNDHNVYQFKEEYTERFFATMQEAEQWGTEQARKSIAQMKRTDLWYKVEVE